MNTREIATIEFQDAESGEPAVAIVRQIGNAVAVCLSLRHGGDMELMMDREIASRFNSAIEEAISTTPK